MCAFVPGGQAGEESAHLTHEAEVEAMERSELRDAERRDAMADRPSLLERILNKLRGSS